MNESAPQTDITDFALAGVASGDAGRVDRLLGDLALRLQQRGVRLAGAVQCDIERSGRSRCDMILLILGSESRYTISADLGPLSRGCRLDAGALETAAWEVEKLLRGAPGDALPQLVIINKFSKSEALGKGFSSAIALAIELGIPVLCGIGRLSLLDFQAFADGQAELLEPNEQLVEHWATTRVLGASPTPVFVPVL